MLNQSDKGRHRRLQAVGFLLQCGTLPVRITVFGRHKWQQEHLEMGVVWLQCHVCLLHIAKHSCKCLWKKNNKAKQNKKVQPQIPAPRPLQHPLSSLGPLLLVNVCVVQGGVT